MQREKEWDFGFEFQKQTSNGCQGWRIEREAERKRVVVGWAWRDGGGGAR